MPITPLAKDGDMALRGATVGAESHAEDAGWSARPALAATVRATTFLVPVGLAMATILGAARLLPHPTTVPGQVARLAGFFAASWVVAWCAHRVLQRLLPLAALLEMSLCFPQTAPSRLRLAQRSGSARQLALLLTAPAKESTQQAAERMLALMTALGAHDRKTRGHAERVRAYAELIAASMGLPARDRDRLRWAALLHDIGKLHVPAALLNKAGKPDPAEWTILRDHPRAGAEIAGPLLEWLKPMHLVIAEHHERWDGTGYPAGIAGQSLSEGSRIVQVADAFEVMTSARSYQRPVRKDAALRELVRCSGSQFDPRVVRAMVAVPNRKLLWAAGPIAWLAELPLLGVNTTSLIGSTASQLGSVAATATATAAIVGAATLTPGAHAPAFASGASLGVAAPAIGSSAARTGLITGTSGGRTPAAALGASLVGGAPTGARPGGGPAPGGTPPGGSNPGGPAPGGPPGAAGSGAPGPGSTGLGAAGSGGPGPGSTGSGAAGSGSLGSGAGSSGGAVPPATPGPSGGGRLPIPKLPPVLAAPPAPAPEIPGLPPISPPALPPLPPLPLLNSVPPLPPLPPPPPPIQVLPPLLTGLPLPPLLSGLIGLLPPLFDHGHGKKAAGKVDPKDSGQVPAG